jgi:multisubunit Na+/H+ antiporter MnhE subunit
MVESLPGVALWSGTSLGIWLLTLSSLSWGELVVGGACSLAVGVVTVAAQRAVGARWAPTASSLRPVLAVPLAIVTNAVQVVALPFRRPDASGRFESVDIDAAGQSPEAATRRAIATLATTATPASIVVDVDSDSGVMKFHALPTSGTDVKKGFVKQ